MFQRRFSSTQRNKKQKAFLKMNSLMRKFIQLLLHGRLFFRSTTVPRKSCISLYQSETGCHRSPRSHGFFDPILWMVVAPPIFVANKNWAHLENLRSSGLILWCFVLITCHTKKNDNSPFTYVRFLFLRMQIFWPYLFLRIHSIISTIAT